MNDDATDGRWFTGAPNGHIAVDFTATENETVETILAFARNSANRDHELMHCVSGDGMRVIDTSTGRKMADLTEMMRLVAAKEPVRFWHNHPSQDSLSRHDWTLAATKSSIEILALNECGSIFVGRMLKWRDEFDELLRQFPSIAGELELKMSHFAKSAKMDIDHEIAFSQRTGHVLNLALSRCQVVEYSHCFSKDDEAIMQVAERLGVVAVGLDFAVREINKLVNQPVAPAPPPGSE